MLVFLFICFSFLAYNVNSKLTLGESSILFFILLILLAYIIYVNQINKEHFNTKAREITAENKNTDMFWNRVRKEYKASVEDEEESENDKLDGYVKKSVWQRISELPTHLNENILTPLKQMANNLNFSRPPQGDDNVSFDYYYVKENADTYKQLGLINEDGDVDLQKLENFKMQFNFINIALSNFKKYSNDFYHQIQKFYGQ